MKKVIRFTWDVVAEEEKTLTYKMPVDGTLLGIYTKFYGSMKLLQVKPMIEKFGLEIATDIIQYVGDDDFLSGDFEEIEEPINLKLYRGDILIVYAKNIDPAITHSLNFHMIVDL